MKVTWEEIDSKMADDFGAGYLQRAKVPGGWLIIWREVDTCGLTFYPDPKHEWDGNSFP